MGIGMVTLSIAPNKNNKTEESINIVELNEDKSNSNNDNGNTISGTVTPTQATTPTPSPSPTPTPLPVYNLEEDGYPKITKLMKSYYKAKLNCDVDNFKTILSDPTNIESKKQLQKDIQYVEDYNKIKCYVKKGFIKDTYIVYVYNEVKFINIDTPAPATDQFYVVTDDEGNVKIFSGEFDAETEEYYRARLQDADVIKLLDETNAKAKKAKKKDKDLKSFWDKLENNQ